VNLKKKKKNNKLDANDAVDVDAFDIDLILS
jgi:hypothetical protein